MTAPQAIHARPSTPGRSTGRFASLPPAILSQSCKRVGTAAFAFAGVWTIAILLSFTPVRNLPGFPWPGNIFAGVGVIISLGMAFTARKLHDRPELLLNIGLGFEVASALLVGFTHFWVLPDTIGQDLNMVSWVVVIILVYPSIAPNTPRKILIASLLAASMDPLALGITALRGVDVSAAASHYVNWFLPNYIAAFLAVLPAHIIGRLSREVRQARELGSYRLEDILGRGGMGEVHRATHRLLARPAAIKLIRPEVLASSGEVQSVVIERFKREARAAAELRSPHTIELYDFGLADDGTFYYVMELLDGLDFETLVETHGPVPPERAVHFLRQACLSLGEAHQHGLVHRDIKPGNIFTSRLGLTVDFVKVLDFGLVKALDAPNEVKLTAPEIATGTPAYMAPEVALGEEIDVRADVYSLGCVLYWLLTGQLLFEADNALKMMYRQIEGDPVPPSSRSELEIPKALDDLVMKTLEKRRDDRPADAIELGCLLGKLDLSPPWTDDRAQRWWETHLPTCPKAEPCEPRVLAPALTGV